MYIHTDLALTQGERGSSKLAGELAPNSVPRVSNSFCGKTQRIRRHGTGNVVRPHRNVHIPGMALRSAPPFQSPVPPKDFLVSSMKRCLSGGWISSFPAARHGPGFSGIHRCATSIICRLLVEVPSPKSAILHLSGVSADEAALNQYGRSIKDVSCSAFPSRVIHFSQGLERVRPRSFVGREMSGGYFP